MEVAKLIIIYNNLINPYVKLKYYDKNNTLINERDQEFKLEDLKDGLPSANALVNYIKLVGIDKAKIYLVLNVKEAFKITNTMPQISLNKAKALVKQDIQNNYEHIENKYYIIEEQYNGETGYVFYHYLTPKYMVDFFNGILKPMKKKLEGYESLANYVVETNVGINEKEYFYIYTSHDVSTFIINYKGNIYSYMNTQSNFDSLQQAYLTMLNKHSYDLEKKEIKALYSNKINEEFKEKFYIVELLDKEDISKFNPVKL